MIERLENAVFVEWLLDAVVGDAEVLRAARHDDNSAVVVVYKCVFEQIREHHSNQCWVDLRNEGSIPPRFNLDVAVAVNGLQFRQNFLENSLEINILRFVELSVFDFAEREKRLIQFRHIFKRMDGLEQVCHLLFAERFVVEYHFKPVHRGGNGRLKFVRGISDEFLLLFEEFLAAFQAFLDRRVQLSKLLNARRVVERLVGLSNLEVFHPFQQSPQRTHCAVDGEYIDGDNGQQQGSEKR